MLHKKRVFFGVSLLASLLLQACTSSRDPFYNLPDRPEELCSVHVPTTQITDAAFRPETKNYVVQKGDTLWDISNRFLKQPWLWKQIWHSNPQIKNPNLIYPGDVLSIVNINGQPRITITEANPTYHGSATSRYAKNGLRVYKYRPQASVENLEDEPVSITGRALAPFLMQTEIFKAEEVENLPFIISNKADLLSLTNQEIVYSQSVPEGTDEFDIYRVAERFIDPLWDVKTHQGPRYQDPGAVAYEMQFVGKATLAGQDSATGLYELKVGRLAQPLQENDVLIPVKSTDTMPVVFFPQEPAANCSQGYMLRNTNHQTQAIKQFDTVVTSFGAEDRARIGDIWKIVRKNPPRVINGNVVEMPSTDLGYLMIMKVYDQFSLGLVIESKDIIYDNDALVRP